MKHFPKGSTQRNLDRPRTTNDSLAKMARYREKNRERAIFLLEKLLRHAPAPLPMDAKKGDGAASDVLTILVIGAGTFPSYGPVIAAISKQFPQVKHLNFCLVEPVQALTELFLKNFARCPVSSLTVKITVDSRDSQAFLQQATQPLFDLVYFEHPDVMTLPIVLARMGFRRFRHCSTLRESLPFIGNVLKPTGFMVASCMSKHEVKQLRSLLDFSGYRKTQLVTSSKLGHFFYGGPFTSGLYCSAHRSPKAMLQPAIAKAIRFSDHYLCVALVLSFIFYIIYCTQAGPGVRAISVFFMLAQLWLHRPGNRGLMIKFLLLIGQIALV